MRGLLLLGIFFGVLPLVIFKSPFIGVLLWFWISLMNPHKLVFMAGGLNYALIAAVVTLVSLLLTRDEPKFPPRDATTLLLMLMMIWICVSSLQGIGPADLIIEDWSNAEKMLLMTLVAYAITNTRERFDQLVLVCVLSVGFFGLRGGVSTILHGGTGRVYGPPGSMIGDNNDLGVALTMILPLIFYLRQRYRQAYLKWPFLALFGLSVVGDLFTYSRGAFLAITAMACMLCIRARQKFLLMLMVAAVAGGVLEFAPTGWFQRIDTIETHDDASSQGRLYYWQLSWAMALRHPIAGAGFRWSFDPASVNRELQGSGLPDLTRPRATHSIWFEALSSHGFVGLGLFVSIIACTALNAQWLIRHTTRRKDLAWANHFGRMLQVALTGYIVGGTFVTLEMYDGFYVVVILAAIARRLVALGLKNEDTVAAASFRSRAPTTGIWPSAI